MGMSSGREPIGLRRVRSSPASSCGGSWAGRGTPLAGKGRIPCRTTACVQLAHGMSGPEGTLLAGGRAEAVGCLMNLGS